MSEQLMAAVERANEAAAFNRWCEYEVLRCGDGEVELAMPWRTELGQYSGFAHAGVVSGLIDTACGFAAATRVGPRLLAAHISVNCLRPASGQRFVAKARVVKSGRQQVFTTCDLFAEAGGSPVLVATGETLLTVLRDADAGGR